MKTILFSFIGLITIFTANNDYFNLNNLRFDISEEEIYQDLLNSDFA